MGIEIERKFLIRSDAWRQGAVGTPFRQGYLHKSEEKTVRVRLAGDRGFLTIKGSRSMLTRSEFEYEIPTADAEALLELCDGPLIDKTRYRVDYAGHTWEIDEFYGDNQGLIVAEIELDTEETVFEKPEWIGEEVSDDPRYFNSNLSKHPYSKWEKDHQRDSTQVDRS